MTTSPFRLGLEVRGLTIKYGGNIAVDDFSFEAPLGQITGLIGPNGAGKTTTFNACSNLLRPTAGRVHCFGAEVTRHSPARRARAGIGRTFQRMALFDSMTVRENVALGREARLAGQNPLRQILSTPAEQRLLDEATDEALEMCGLQDLAGHRVQSLSTGQRRLVDLARVLSGGFTMLLLDEPSSGLDTTETERFGEILHEVVATGKRGILLVEHDMGLVMDVCRYLYVLDFGKLIFEGTPEQTRASEVVRAAYLGTEAA
jgi:ABC-type branched-subunit amino acid transport system ATPase component